MPINYIVIITLHRCAKDKMRPIVTNVSVVCVCLLATTVSCAKTAEPIEMPSVFGDDVHV